MNSELAKLIYDFWWDRNKTFQVYNVRKKLSPTWFEYYIKLYFEKILWYKIKIPTDTYNPDWWIDLKGLRCNKDWEIEYCVIQCKKHKSSVFGINDIRAFLWGIFHILHNYPNTIAFYITTSQFSEPALKFWQQEWISLMDYTYVAKISEQYSLSDFEKDIKNEYPWKYSKIFNKWRKNSESILQWQLFQSIEDELLKTLKNIRYSLMKKYHIYESSKISSTDILQYLSRKRPHNLDALKSSLYEADFPKEDIHNILIYSEDFMKWLNLYIK